MDYFAVLIYLIYTHFHLSNNFNSEEELQELQRNFEREPTYKTFSKSWRIKDSYITVSQMTGLYEVPVNLNSLIYYCYTQF